MENNKNLLRANKMEKVACSIIELFDIILENKRPCKKDRTTLSSNLDFLKKCRNYKHYSNIIIDLSDNVKKSQWSDELWKDIFNTTHTLKPIIERRGISNIVKLLNDLKKGIIDEDNNTYNNIKISKLLQKAGRINIKDFINKHCLYIFATGIRTEYINDERIDIVIIKVGYTYNLFDRCKTLEKEYGEPFFLLFAKEIYSEQNEKNLHKKLRKLFPDNHITGLKINGVEKNELYTFDMDIINFVCNYQSKSMSKEVHERIMIDKQILHEEKKSDNLDKQIIFEEKKSDNLDKQIIIEENKTKQKRLDLEIEQNKTEQLRLQLKLSGKDTDDNDSESKPNRKTSGSKTKRKTSGSKAKRKTSCSKTVRK